MLQINNKILSLFNYPSLKGLYEISKQFYYQKGVYRKKNTIVKSIHFLLHLEFKIFIKTKGEVQNFSYNEKLKTLKQPFYIIKLNFYDNNI